MRAETGLNEAVKSVLFKLNCFRLIHPYFQHLKQNKKHLHQQSFEQDDLKLNNNLNGNFMKKGILIRARRH